MESILFIIEMVAVQTVVLIPTLYIILIRSLRNRTSIAEPAVTAVDVSVPSIRVAEAIVQLSEESNPQFMVLDDMQNVQYALLSFGANHDNNYVVRVEIKLQPQDDFIILEEHRIGWVKPTHDSPWIMEVDGVPSNVSHALFINTQYCWEAMQLSLAQVSGKTAVTQFAMW